MFNLLTTQQFHSPIFWSITVFSWIGSLVAIVAFLPQSLKTIRSKKTNDVSVVTFTIYTLANSLWFIWGILDLIYNGRGDKIVLLKDLVIIVTNIPCALWAFLILLVKLYNMYYYGEDCKKWAGKKYYKI